MGTEGGASEATLWPPGPPPTPAAQPRTGASLPTETLCSPGVWRGARLLAPARTLRRSGSDARISPPSGGWGYGGTYRDLRLEPPKTTSPPGRRPGATGTEGPSETGEAGGAPPTRQRVPGQCEALAVRALLRETLVCVLAAGRRAQPGPSGLHAPRPVSSGPGSRHLPRTLTLQRPGAH